jgi:hypothetical protein
MKRDQVCVTGHKKDAIFQNGDTTIRALVLDVGLFVVPKRPAVLASSA